MKKFWKKVQNIGRSGVDAATDALSDTARDGKYAIQDMEKQVSGLTEKLIKFNADKKQREAELAAAKKEAKKYYAAATAAVEKGEDTDATKFLDMQAEAQSKVDLLKTEVKTLTASYQNLVKTKEDMEKTIREKKMVLSSMSARSEGAKLRKEMAEAAAGIGDKGAFGAFEELEKESARLELEAESAEELAGGDELDADAYLAEAKAPSATDRLAALKAKMEK